MFTLTCDSLVVQEEQEFSAGQSALVNRVYSTLLKPYSRGLYLVRRGRGGKALYSTLLRPYYRKGLYLVGKEKRREERERTYRWKGRRVRKRERGRSEREERERGEVTEVLYVSVIAGVEWTDDR